LTDEDYSPEFRSGKGLSLPHAPTHPPSPYLSLKSRALGTCRSINNYIHNTHTPAASRAHTRTRAPFGSTGRKLRIPGAPAAEPYANLTLNPNAVHFLRVTAKDPNEQASVFDVSCSFQPVPKPKPCTLHRNEQASLLAYL